MQYSFTSSCNGFLGSFNDFNVVYQLLHRISSVSGLVLTLLSLLATIESGLTDFKFVHLIEMSDAFVHSLARIPAHAQELFVLALAAAVLGAVLDALILSVFTQGTSASPPALRLIRPSPSVVDAHMSKGRPVQRQAQGIVPHGSSICVRWDTPADHQHGHRGSQVCFGARSFLRPSQGGHPTRISRASPSWWKECCGF